MFMRYHGSGVGHVDPTDVEEAENVEPEEVVGNGQAGLSNNLAEVDDPETESSDTEDGGDGVSDPGESSDEEAANDY